MTKDRIMTNDYEMLDALQRVGAVCGVRVMEADCKAYGEVVSREYAIIEFGSEGEPASIAICRTIGDLSLEMECLVQDALERNGAHRFMTAIEEGDISAAEFNDLAGDIDGPWRVEVESRLLKNKLPAGAVVQPAKRL